MSSEDAGETPSTTNDVPTEPHAEAEHAGGEQGDPGADQTGETADTGGPAEGGAAQADAGEGQAEPAAAHAAEEGAADDGGSSPIKADDAARPPLDEVQRLQQELAASLEKVKSLAALAEERRTKIQMLELQLEGANKGSPGEGKTDEANEGGSGPSGEQAEGGDPGASLSEWANQDGGSDASKAEAEKLAKKCKELEGQVAEAEGAKANLQAELERVSSDLAKSEESAAQSLGESQKELEEVKADLATAAKLVETLETKNAESDKALVESNETIRYARYHDPVVLIASVF